MAWHLAGLSKLCLFIDGAETTTIESVIGKNDQTPMIASAKTLPRIEMPIDDDDDEPGPSHHVWKRPHHVYKRKKLFFKIEVWSTQKF